MADGDKLLRRTRADALAHVMKGRRFVVSAKWAKQYAPDLAEDIRDEGHRLVGGSS